MSHRPEPSKKSTSLWGRTLWWAQLRFDPSPSPIQQAPFTAPLEDDDEPKPDFSLVAGENFAHPFPFTHLFLQEWVFDMMV